MNTADVQTIADALKGIGDKTAEAIIQSREKEGLFEKASDLLEVDGVTQKMVDDNQHLMQFVIPKDAE